MWLHSESTHICTILACNLSMKYLRRNLRVIKISSLTPKASAKFSCWSRRNSDKKMLNYVLSLWKYEVSKINLEKLV